MYNSITQYAIENFFKKVYFESEANEYLLIETEEDGKSELKVTIDNTNIVISQFDNKCNLDFVNDSKKVGMNKSVDHVIFKKKDTNWEVHLIEMKSSVGYETWKSIKAKVRSCYLKTKAIAVFLGIDLKEAHAYTTYELDKFENHFKETTNPILLKPFLGEKPVDFKYEWDNNFITINLGEEIIISCLS